MIATSRLLRALVALSVTAVTALALPAFASAACGGTASRAHSTSSRSGTVWVRACDSYGTWGVSTRTSFGLQEHYLRGTVYTYDVTGGGARLVATKSDSRGSTSDLFIDEMTATSFSKVRGHSYRTKVVLRYDVKNDGPGEFSLTAWSPGFRA